MTMASSSSATPQVKYEVFLSFRGKDTRNSFTSHLYAALCREKIKTFIDDQIDRGDDISSSLLNTIKASKISIIIFSKKYADSRWCLRELEQILECRRTCGQIAIPVFYHVRPSHIRNKTEAFGKAFTKLEERFAERLDELKRWQSALKEAANLSGWPIDDETPENVLLERIVADILSRLNKLHRPCDDKTKLVGVEVSLQKIESLLCLQSNGVHIVGIWGMGGIGKTTISLALFNKISGQFESSYFAENVREVSEKCGISSLKEKLLSTLLEDRNINPEQDYTIERLRRKKVFIVFDDVTQLEQIEKLVGQLESLHPKSRIVITSRDKQKLKVCGVHTRNIYEVMGLCDKDALQLFSKYAFKQNYPSEDFMELSKNIVMYAKGVPLALKVLGSCLSGKREQEWKSEIDKLENSPHQDIHKILKLSYDGLDDEERSIFLDIACFFKGWRKSLVQDILDATGFSTFIGISSLIDKSLITLSYEEIISMHDLLQKMGQKIVRQESIDPGIRSRLWYYKDIYNVLQRNMGTAAIQGISLDTDEVKSAIRLNPHAFRKMHNLRFLHVYSSKARYYYEDDYQNKLHSLEELESVSTKVVLWERCPLKSLQKFDVENLVRLEMRHSKVEKLWNGIQNLVNLKHIDLGESECLTQIPNLSKALNLQELILDDCVSLLEINSSSIENLKELVKLVLKSCEKLISLPDFIQSKSIDLSFCKRLKMAPKISWKVEMLDLKGTSIKELSFIEDASRLVSLNISFCSRPFERLSSNICKCKHLQHLFLDHLSALGSILDDFGNLEALEMIEINSTMSTAYLSPLPSVESYTLCEDQGRDPELEYRVLNALPVLRSLKHLCIVSCQVTKLPDNLGQVSSLQYLLLSFNDFDSIPSSIKDLSSLRSLEIMHCKKLRSLPELPRGINVNASHCTSLESISNLSFLFSPKFRPQQVIFADCPKLNLSKILHGLEIHQEICDYVCYPGNEIPKWISVQTRGSYASLEQPPDWEDKNFIGLIVCAVSQRAATVTCSLYIKTKADEIRQYQILDMHYLYLDHVILGFAKSVGKPLKVLGPQNNYEDYNSVRAKMGDGKVLFKFHYNTVKMCGVHFLYAQNCGKPAVLSKSAYYVSSDSRLLQLSLSTSNTCEGQSSMHSNKPAVLLSSPYYNSSDSRSLQPSVASNTCEGQSSWDFNELPQNLNGSTTLVIGNTNLSLEDYNGAELGGSGYFDGQDKTQPSSTGDGQSGGFPWDLNELPQDFNGSTMAVIATTNLSLEDHNGAELNRSSRFDGEYEPQPKRLKGLQIFLDPLASDDEAQ